MNNSNRIQYYFGDFYQKKISVEITESLCDFRPNQPFFYRGSDYPAYVNNVKMNPCFWFQHADFCIDIPCIALSGDGYHNKGLPALTKVREIGVTNNGILLKLNIKRHWSILDNPPKDLDWSDKLSDVIWRGHHAYGFWKRPNRLNLVEKYYKKYNIKFYFDSDITPTTPPHTPREFFTYKFLEPSDHLKYKYIISMEGNDVSTGLKWMLNSNSLVIMPKPKTESWLMEGLLRPGEHYLELNDDLDNLDEIVDWCRNNDEECRRIVKNANIFMEKFKNHDNEKYLFDSIIKQYQENVKFII